MDIIFGDIRYILAEKLECKDLWKLSKIGRKERIIDLIHKKCLKKIKYQLKKILEDKYEEFIELLYKTGAAISGSFILQCLLNEDWGSDIDILISTKEITPEFINFMEKYNYTSIYYVQNCKRDMMGISGVRCAEFLETKIQFLLVNNNEIRDFILGNFDFDIVKNVFQENKLYIHDYEQIFSKRTEYKVGKISGSSIIRRVKYEYRGFSFYQPNYSCESLKKWLEYKFIYAIPISLVCWGFKKLIL